MKIWPEQSFFMQEIQKWCHFTKISVGHFWGQMLILGVYVWHKGMNFRFSELHGNWTRKELLCKKLNNKIILTKLWLPMCHFFESPLRLILGPLGKNMSNNLFFYLKYWTRKAIILKIKLIFNSFILIWVGQRTIFFLNDLINSWTRKDFDVRK